MEINDILFWLCWFVLMWNGYFLLVNKGVPNIRTAPAMRRRIVELLKEDMAARPEVRPYIVYDMGSGNGLFTRQMAKELPEAKVVGLEFSAPAFHCAEAMRKRCGLDNLSYINGDFFEHDVSDAAAVVMYLTIYEMGRMGEKLKEELKPGTLVTSNRFKLGAGWEPKDVLEIKTFYPHQKYLNVYRKG